MRPDPTSPFPSDGTPELSDSSDTARMSRFSNLEFSSHPEGESRTGTGEITRDETFFLNDAWKAFEEGDFERGLRSFSKVLEFNAQNVGAWSGQVRMLIELGEYSEAKLWADKALERFPRDPELLAAKGVALARQGDLKAALAFSDAAFEERGETSYLWVARADILLARSEPRADYCLEKAITLSPGSWFIRWLISRVHVQYERFASGLKLAQEALAIDASQAVLWLQLAICQRELGLVGAASGSLAQALQLNPRLPGARRMTDRLNRVTLLDQLRAWINYPFSR